MSALELLLRQAQALLADASTAGQAGDVLANAIAQLDSERDTCSKRIERERRRLLQAREVLTCLAVALDEEADIAASDVAEAVRDMVTAAVNGLDSVALARPAHKKGAP